MPNAFALQIRTVPFEPSTVIAFPRKAAQDAASPAIEPQDQERVALLRDCLAAARLSGRDDLDRICARIVFNAPTTSHRYGVALFQALPEAARQGLTFHRSGARSLSDDERWLLRLIRSVETDDYVNIEALLGFRIKPSHQRCIRLLVSELANSLQAADTDDEEVKASVVEGGL